MKKTMSVLFALITLLAIFSSSTFAASGGEETLLSSSLQGPMALLSFCTLGVMLFLTIKDHN